MKKEDCQKMDGVFFSTAAQQLNDGYRGLFYVVAAPGVEGEVEPPYRGETSPRFSNMSDAMNRATADLKAMIDSGNLPAILTEWREESKRRADQ